MATILDQEKAGTTGECLGTVEKTFNAAKSAISETIGDGRAGVERAIRRGRNAVQDQVDEATYRIKREPMRSVGIAFAAGVILGFVLPRFGRR